MKKLPEHVVSAFGSSRAFKREKRRQIRDVLRAMDNLATGCAYLNGSAYREFERARETMRKIADECSAKNWGR